MIRSRPFGNAAGSAARIAPSRRSEQLALVLLEIELSQEHIKNETPKKARGTGGPGWPDITTPLNALKLRLRLLIHEDRIPCCACSSASHP